MKLTILGASGHGKVIADIAKLNGYDEIDFLDDDNTKVSCGGYPVSGRCDYSLHIKNDMFVAIGNAEYREKYLNLLDDKYVTTLIHPNAVIAKDVTVGKGTVIMAGTVINSGAIIGKGCIINTCSSVDHDCIVGNYVHIAVGAHLCGTVKIGDRTWIGAGCTINNNISICGGCMIGAGAVVVKEIETAGTYIGIPAVQIKKSGS